MKTMVVSVHQLELVVTDIKVIPLSLLEIASIGSLRTNFSIWNIAHSTGHYDRDLSFDT